MIVGTETETETETAMGTVVENDGAQGHLGIEIKGRLGVKWKWIPIHHLAITELVSVKTDTPEEIIVMSEDGTETGAKGVKGAIEEIGEIGAIEVREATEATEE